MSHSRKAAVASLFTYTQFALAIISGIVLFPLVINSVGSYAYGLWLATGEAISYVLLGDLGVFGVLPWLIAGRLGANDLVSLRQIFSNAIAVGTTLGMLSIASCSLLLLLDPTLIGVSQEFWKSILYPTVLLLVLHGLCYPLKAFNALLVGVQDVYVSGTLSVIQSLSVIALTVWVVLSGSGILGLALAAGLPPLIVAILASGRVWFRHLDLIRGMQRPSLSGCRSLFKEGFGAWLAGLGVRLMAASNGIILAGVGRPDWATLYVSTGKIAQIFSPLCATIPDSGLVGVSHVHGTKNLERTRSSVICLILLYLVLPSLAAIGLLIANPAFVGWWIGDELYAGHYVNALLAANLILAGVAGGCAKLASVVGWRQTVGWTTLIAGAVYVGVGYPMAYYRGLAGLAETGLLVWALIVLPVGAYLMGRIYGVHWQQLTQFGFGRWFACSLPAFAISTSLGIYLWDQPLLAFCVSVLGVMVYAISLKPLLTRAPWPIQIQVWLSRLSLGTRAS